MPTVVFLIALVTGLLFLYLTSKRALKLWTIKRLRDLAKKDRRAAYTLYLSTWLWREKRKECFKHDTYRCSRCGSPHRLEAHHITYRNLFNEKKGDLRAWCHDCHAAYAPKSAGLFMQGRS